jgi:GNAT superfamily N-acetyltransferase
MAGMNEREIRAVDDTDFTEWFAIQAQALLADDPAGPQWAERELKVRHQPDEYRDVMLWLAEEEGQAVGAAVLSLPKRDNVHLAEPEVFVRPQARRRGIGTALLGVAEAAARDRGRTSMLTYLGGATATPHTPGVKFAERHGFSHRITEIRRVQQPPFPFDDIDRAVKVAEPHAAKYEFITWRDRAPDNVVHENARLEARMSTDPPQGEVEYESEAWDEARIRSAERRAAQMGRGLWTTAALSVDGSMAGITTLVLPLSSDDHAFQGTTIVDPDHRGHRLGLLLKATNFAAFYAERPGIKKIWTWNAEDNSHMIAINEIMGYRVQGWDKAYQRDIVFA